MGQCCAQCVMGFSQACNAAMAQYQGERQAYLSKYGEAPCKQDTDCGLVFESNACVSTCGVALPVSTASFYANNLIPAAMTCDASCPPLPPPPCARLNAVCSNGMCTALPAGLGLQ